LALKIKKLLSQYLKRVFCVALLDKVILPVVKISMKKLLFLLVSLLALHSFASAQNFPNIRLSSTLLNFDADGDTALTNHRDSLALWIYNRSSDTLVVRDINFIENVFSTRDTAFSVRPNDSAGTWVYFRSNQNLTFADVMTIENRGASGTLVLPVRATAKYNYSTAVEARYRLTQGLTGTALRTALTTIISSPYQQVGYSNRLPMFSIIDNWKINGRGSSADKCECVYTGRIIENYPFNTGTLASAPWVFNTEHTWPQGQFNENEPMRSDYHHLFPTDNNENNNRGSFPFDNVTTVTTTNGGSRRGTNANGAVVYEPRDAQKGRTARAMLYFITRYTQNFGDFWAESGVNQEAAFRGWNQRFPPDSIDSRRNSSLSAKSESIYRSSRVC
jgi:hypothetical protein